MAARSVSGPLSRMRFFMVGLLLGAVLATTGAAQAVAPEDSLAYDLAGEVMSPFCPGRTLSSCPSPQAAELIQWVVLQESAGATREEVEEQLYVRYGDAIRSAPKPEGWGLAAYVIPLLAAVLGIGLVVWILRRLSAGGTPQQAAMAGAVAAAEPAHEALRTPADDEIERLVDQELEQL